MKWFYYWGADNSAESESNTGSRRAGPGQDYHTEHHAYGKNAATGNTDVDERI